jgi:hypothetical protein
LSAVATVRAVYVQETDASDFPWLTIREVPAMTRYGARCGAEAEKDAPTVTTPDGRELAVTDAALAAELTEAHGQPIRL